MRIAVIGHVEHVTIGAVPRLPAPGDIVHLDAPIVVAGGGGGIAFHQLAKSDAELHLFTALGDDDAADFVRTAIEATGAAIHSAARRRPHTRDLVLVTEDGERTIYVVGEPLHPTADDPLPWDLLSSCDVAYFTGDDPAMLSFARNARLLVVTARRSEAYAASGVTADIIVGSLRDPREASCLADYAVRPRALVMTDGARGGVIETASGRTPFNAPVVSRVVGSYGAGDTFAGALTYYAAMGMPLRAACELASRRVMAVLGGIDPIAGQQPLG
jgi:ribokinase